MSDPILVLLKSEPLSPEDAEAAVTSDADGGICTFVGRVRNHNDGATVSHLVYEAYEPMALQEMTRVGRDALAASGARAIAVHHRLGRLEVGEVSVVIACSAAHRDQAFAGCRHAIEDLKASVPIWKHEYGPGRDAWVAGHGAATEASSTA